MNIDIHHEFSAPVDAVAAMFARQEFADARAEAAGALEFDTVVDQTEEGVLSVAIRRKMPTTDIPQQFRSFVGPSLTVRYTEVWEPATESGRTATFAVEIVGVPARASGTLLLTPSGTGSQLAVSGVVSAAVPFLGNLVAEAVAKALSDGLAAELAAADAWLASA